MSEEVKINKEQKEDALKLEETKEPVEVEMDQEELKEQRNYTSTFQLDQLDLSYLAEKRIEPVKRRNKVERLKELQEAGMEEDNNENIGEIMARLERHIRLMDGFEDYLLEDPKTIVTPYFMKTKIKSIKGNTTSKQLNYIFQLCLNSE